MYIVDTNVLMGTADFGELIHRFNGLIKIPMEVLAELDKLKTVEGEKGFKARRAIRGIESFENKGFEYISRGKVFYHKLDRNRVSMDDIIISYFEKREYKSAVLITNDVAMRIKAKAIGVTVVGYHDVTDVAKCDSIVEVRMTIDEYLEFCDNLEEIEEVPIGGYLIVRDEDDSELRAIWRYLGEEIWDEVPRGCRVENYLFKVKPKDEFQRCAIDSLKRDDFTVITGPAGTGKTLLSLGYALEKIKREGSQLHVFVNPAKTRGSEELGFYPGSRNEKLLQNFIGDVLRNKIGDMTEVHRLISEESINIYPVSDIRGIEIKKGDIMYITEAQNLSVDMIKLAIQRCAEGAKIIIEGDPYTQVDKTSFEGEGSGLKRVVKVFRGFEGFSHIHLPNIYRSKIADRADKL